MKELLRCIYCEFIEQNEASSEMREQFITLPNLVTGIGLLLTGFYVMQYLTGFLVWYIPCVVALIGASDFFDGLLARHANQHSWFGKFFDPLRDKCIWLAFMGNLVVVLGSSALVPFVIVAAVELYMTHIDWRNYTKRVLVHGHPVVRTLQPITLLLIFASVVDMYWFGIISSALFLALAWFCAVSRLIALFYIHSQ